MSQSKISLLKFVRAVESAYRVGVILNKKVDGISFETKQKKIKNKDYLEFTATTDKYGMTGTISSYGIHKGIDGIIFTDDGINMDSNINERIVIRKQGIEFTIKQVSDLELLGYNIGLGFFDGITHMKIARGEFSEYPIMEDGE